MRSFQNTPPRAALFHGPDQPLEWIEAPLPVPLRGEILVDIERCAICSSDLHTHSGRRKEPTPTVLGHEIAGRIMAFGEGAPRQDANGQPLEIGDRITWTVAASCGRCANCCDGLTQKCAKLVKYGHEQVTREMPFRGGLADVILLSPGTGIVRLPQDPPSHAPLELLTLANCSTATVAAALRAGFSRRQRPGMSIAILGAGVLGLTACAMARALYGASTIIAVDRDPARAELARQFGATHTCSDLVTLPTVVKDLTDQLGVDVAIELAGVVQTARAAVDIVRTGGTAIIAGTTMPTEPLILEPQTIVRRLLRIEGVHNYTTPDLVTAVDFLLRHGGEFPFQTLVGPSFPLTDLERALTEGHSRPGTRMMILPASV